MMRRQFLHCLYKFGISSIARSCFKYFTSSGFLQHCSTRDSLNHTRHSSSLNSGFISNNKMSKVILFSLILIYYWYFYHFRSKAPTRPATAAPEKPKPFRPDLVVKDKTSFQFFLDGTNVWEHSFPDDSYLVQGFSKKIIPRDDCYYYTTRVPIAATGLSLYKYLKKNPDYKNMVKFKDDSAHTAHKGNVFYFTCSHRQIQSLDMCPSGEIFQNQHCVKVTSCTGKPDDSTLSYEPDPSKYVLCRNGRVFVKDCRSGTLFYHDRCVPKEDLVHLCHFNKTSPPVRIDDTTWFECRDYQPVITRCMPGTQLFDSLVCEPADCSKETDGAKLPLRQRRIEPFRFVPGYMECLKGKVFRTVECPAKWDDALSGGDDLIHLPMVFDGERCAVPSFGENVFSDDPDVMVPVHEFTKHVRNWSHSPQYDRTAGYVSTRTGRKRKSVDPGQRIGKHFKTEPACDGTYPFVKPVDGDPTRYFDCTSRRVERCDAGEYFNGTTCKENPARAFRYRGVPLFGFGNLNAEGWIKPWDYLSGRTALTGCQSAEYRHVKLYDLCAHPDCEDFAFLSSVPNFSMLLPRHQRAKCTFDKTDRHLRKEPVDFGYTFWDQRILPENVNEPDVCTPGQSLKTGHFMVDSTVFATCELSQPFVFCPSDRGRGIELHKGVYACAPPPETVVRQTTIDVHVEYETNEMKRILPVVWDGVDYVFQLNRGDKVPRVLPPEGFEIPRNAKCKLKVNRPVDLELRHRVTFPPNVLFEYDDRGQRIAIVADSTRGSVLKQDGFSTRPLNFPIYEPETHVEGFSEEYHP